MKYCIELQNLSSFAIGAAEVRAKKESEAYNAGDEEGDDAGGEIDVGWRELPRYFKVSCRV